MSISKSLGSILLSSRRVATGSPAGDALENINTAVISDGALCYVETGAGKGTWQFQRGATNSPNGSNVVSPIAGPGRWILKDPSSGWIPEGPIVPRVQIPVGGESVSELDSMAVSNLKALQDAVVLAIEGDTWIQIPGGTIWISDTWRISDVSGLRIVGCGEDSAIADSPATVIQWRNSTAAGKAIVELNGCRGASLRDLKIGANPTYAAEIGLSVRWDGTGTVSTANEFSNIIIDGHSGYIFNCVRIWKDAGASDANNSEHTFFRVRARNYGNRSGIGSTSAGFANLQGQAKAIKYIACGSSPWRGTSPGKYGYYGHGSAHWIASGGGGNDTDFFLTNPNDVFVVDGFYSEESERFLYGLGPSSAPGPVVIRNCRITSFDRSSSGIYSWRVIQLGWAGNLTVENCSIDGSTDDGGTERPAFITIGIVGQPFAATISGNVIRSLDGSSGDVPTHPLEIFAGAEDGSYEFVQNHQKELDGGAGRQWADKTRRTPGANRVFVSNETGVTYTPKLSDSFVELKATDPGSIILPQDSNLDAQPGFEVDFAADAAQWVVTPGTGSTVRAPGNGSRIHVVQGDIVKAQKTASNAWRIRGGVSTLSERVLLAGDISVFQLNTADNIALNNNGRLRMLDSAGAGGHLDAQAESNEGTIVKDGRGLQYVRLDGVDDYFVSALAASKYPVLHDNTEDVAVFVLHFPVDDDEVEWIWATAQNASNQIGAIYNATYINGRYTASIGNGATNIYSEFASGPSPSNVKILTEYRLESGTATNALHWGAGTDSVSAALSDTPSTSDPSETLNVGWRPGVGNYLGSDIRAFVILRRYTTSQLDDVRDALFSEIS